MSWTKHRCQTGEFRECKVKKYRWKAHTETQKHKNNERIEKKEEEKLNNMEEKYEFHD